MNKLLVLLAVLLLCTYSWGACSVTQYLRDSPSGVAGNVRNGCTEQQIGTGLGHVLSECDAFIGTTCRAAGSSYGQFGLVLIPLAIDCSYGACRCQMRVLQCTSEALLDENKCDYFPTAEGCVTETDTTLFACSDNASGNGALYRLACTAVNGVVTSCNGKTNVDIPTDGQLIRPLQGTCAQNGFGTGVIGGATADTSQPQSANADCFAVIGSTCHMRDKASGNTFRCECDGSCSVALRNLMAGNADCSNPYPQPQDSLSFPQESSSSASSPESSEGGSCGGTESSSSGEPVSSGMSDPWTPLLEDIKANTQLNNELTENSNYYLSQIQNNTESANSLLRAIVNKDWNPTINVAAPNVNVQGDTNIINVSVNGDTATAPKNIEDWLKLNGWESSIDTSGRARWNAFTDSIAHSADSVLDSLFNDTIPVMSLDSGLTGFREGMMAFRDSLENSAYADTLEAWGNVLKNTGAIAGDGSNSCPAVLTRQYTLPFLGADIPVGSLGGYLCTPIAGISITLWALARTLIRFIVAFGCMIWIYKAVAGVDGSGEDE